jgi:hypothetical protein
MGRMGCSEWLILPMIFLTIADQKPDNPHSNQRELRFIPVSIGSNHPNEW